MKILVLSDSHAALSFMRFCLDQIKPDIAIHLGDYYDDGCAMAEEYPQVRFYQVPGNCDRHRFVQNAPETIVTSIGGVRMMLTHGHLHGVKSSPWRLIMEARRLNAQAVLFGHTHSAYCQQEDGLWVLNPGSCGYYGGSAGLLTVENGKISDCRILRQSDLE